MGAQITVLREELAPPEPVNKKPPQTQRARFLPRSFTPPLRGGRQEGPRSVLRVVCLCDRKRREVRAKLRRRNVLLR